MSVFIYISQYSVFIPIVLGMMQLSKTNTYLKYLLVLVSFSFISDFATSYNYHWRETMWMLYEIVEISSLLLLFIAVIEVKSAKIMLISILSILLVYFLVYYVYLRHLEVIFPDTRLLESFVFIILSLYYFYYLHTHTPTYDLFSFPLFWINTAVLLYFAGNLFLYAAINIFTMENVYLLYFPIHNVLNAIKNVLFGVAFFVQFQTSKSETKDS